ncbi:MAG: DUF2147 domain-containing protein, partial [Cyanobacteria bacterium P01_G01_bin.49]
MNIDQQVLALTISLTSLLCSHVVAKEDESKLPTSTQTVVQKSTSPIERIWQAEDTYRIQISQNNGTYNGKIVWIAPGLETKDVNNPDQNLRSRELIGVDMLKGFTYDPDKKIWTDGSIYVPDVGKTLNAKLWLVGINQLNAEVSMGPLTRTITLS